MLTTEHCVTIPECLDKAGKFLQLKTPLWFMLVKGASRQIIVGM